MSEEINVEGVTDGFIDGPITRDGEARRCPHPHKPKPNLCNDVVLAFGSDKCRSEDDNLAMAGGAINCAGYAVPDKGYVRALTVTWDNLGCGQYAEKLVLQVNGEDIPGAELAITDDLGTDHLCLEDLHILVDDCDTINIVSRNIDEENCWQQACQVEATVWFTPKCKIKLISEGDGVAEAMDTTGSTDVVNGATWYTRTLDAERNNTMPYFADFIDTEDAYELRWGIYKITYESGIKFDQSTALEYKVKLQENIDGAGWVDIPYSNNIDYVLAGDDGNVSAGRTITYKVDRHSKSKIRIQEFITQDTSIQAAAGGAGIVIERVSNGIALF